MFCIFKNQDERRKFGSTAFMELQYCKLKRGTKIKKIVSINKIKNWQDDSLYIYMDDMDRFYFNYEKCFDYGTYNNLKSGFFDEFGITYYSLEQTEQIIKTIEKEKPEDYQTLLSWLDKVKDYNGFYVLGI